jgi:uncharacterized protein YciI
MKIKLYWIALIVLLPMASAADDVKPLQQFIVHLETGEKWDSSLQPSEQSQFQEHTANMNRLRKQGTILFGARYGEYGLLILEGESLPSAIEILEADPGVMAGIFKFRIEPISIFYPWKTPGD